MLVGPSLSKFENLGSVHRFFPLRDILFACVLGKRRQNDYYIWLPASAGKH